MTGSHAAVDTADHNTLLDRLTQWAGLTGTVLNLIKSYLKDRNYFGSIVKYESE